MYSWAWAPDGDALGVDIDGVPFRLWCVRAWRGAYLAADGPQRFDRSQTWPSPPPTITLEALTAKLATLPATTRLALLTEMLSRPHTFAYGRFAETAAANVMRNLITHRVKVAAAAALDDDEWRQCAQARPPTIAPRSPSCTRPSKNTAPCPKTSTSPSSKKPSTTCRWRASPNAPSWPRCRCRSG